ncbi:serine protease [Achlya hypogyna]|uniref:subtilisin n=1 Tax=Achlya hypogyna TaxID=1202772 RepID=A0A1V9ZM38_ACHHY|nr:serine protease [Achlya hypogyna]
MLRRVLVAALGVAVAVGLPQEPAPLEFTSVSAWCDFHCSPYTVQRDVECGRCGDGRALKEAAPIDFISCQAANLSVQLSIGTEGMSFASFLDDFTAAVDSMVNGDNPVLGACHLAALAPTTAPTHPAAVVPTLVKITRCDHEVDCFPRIKAILGDDTFLRLISRSNGVDDGSTVVLVHTNSTQAAALNALDCTFRVLPLPPLMKLGPFARSVGAVVTSAPAMEIGFLRAVTPEALADLNAQLAVATGINNLLSLLTPTSAYVTSLGNFQVWSRVVIFLSSQDAVLFLTAYSPVRHYSEPMPPILRRLDAQANIVVGVAEAQSRGITGNNVTVGITDTGLYLDHDQFDQPGARPFGRIVPTNRKVVSYEAYGDKWDQSETVTCGHGTHVAGILLGSSLSKAQPDLGIARSAKVAFMDIGTQSPACANVAGINCPVSLQTPSDVGDLLRNQVRAGAKIFSFSWGTDGDDYSQQARDLDAYVYANPETLIVVAVGNAGDEGPRSISSPAGAKNVLSVGASMNTVASLAATLDCPAIFNPNSVASFSSIGPTSDGRLKPDLVVPGQILTSAQSLASGTTTKTAQVCPLQGTSQATPVAAGMAVLVYEWLRDGWWKAGTYDPSFGLASIPASLIKALLVHSSGGLKKRIGPLKGLVTCQFVEQTATDLAYPDANQGYGLPQLSNIAAFGTTTPKVFFLPNNTMAPPTVRHGGLHTYSFTVRPAQTFRVTLVWTDPPGSVAATKQLQNNLDLSVVIPGNAAAVFYPISTRTGPDSVNNVEVVDVSYDALAKLQPGASGPITVQAQIKGTSVLVTSSQAYSLVASSSADDASIPSAGSSGAAPASGNGGTPLSGQQSAATTGFEWKTWMTIVVGVVGAVIVALFLALVCRQQRAPASAAFVRTTTPREMAGYPRAMPQPLMQAPPERCPFCPFVSPDPARLVHHVENVHPEV